MSDWKKFYEFLKGYKPREFVRETYQMDGAHCVVGAAIPEVAAHIRDYIYAIKIDHVEAFSEVPGVADEESAVDYVMRLLQDRTGLSVADLEEVQRRNDDFEGSPRERYEDMLRYAEERAS